MYVKDVRTAKALSGKGDGSCEGVRAEEHRIHYEGGLGGGPRPRSICGSDEGRYTQWVLVLEPTSLESSTPHFIGGPRHLVLKHRVPVYLWNGYWKRVSGTMNRYGSVILSPVRHHLAPIAKEVGSTCAANTLQEIELQGLRAAQASRKRPRAGRTVRNLGLQGFCPARMRWRWYGRLKMRLRRERGLKRKGRVR